MPVASWIIGGRGRNLPFRCVLGGGGCSLILGLCNCGFDASTEFANQSAFVAHERALALDTAGHIIPVLAWKIFGPVARFVTHAPTGIRRGEAGNDSEQIRHHVVWGYLIENLICPVSRIHDTALIVCQRHGSNGTSLTLCRLYGVGAGAVQTEQGGAVFMSDTVTF